MEFDCKARGRIDGCEIFGNSGSGIMLCRHSYPIISGSTIRDHSNWGVHDDGWSYNSKLENNNIFANNLLGDHNAPPGMKLAPPTSLHDFTGDLS